jgi:hypothetical protein
MGIRRDPERDEVTPAASWSRSSPRDVDSLVADVHLPRPPHDDGRAAAPLVLRARHRHRLLAR